MNPITRKSMLKLVLTERSGKKKMKWEILTNKSKKPSALIVGLSTHLLFCRFRVFLGGGWGKTSGRGDWESTICKVVHVESCLLRLHLLSLIRNRNSWNKPNNCSFSGYSFQSGCKTFIVTLLTGSDMSVINSGPKRKDYSDHSSYFYWSLFSQSIQFVFMHPRWIWKHLRVCVEIGVTNWVIGILSELCLSRHFLKTWKQYYKNKSLFCWKM